MKRLESARIRLKEGSRRLTFGGWARPFPRTGGAPRARAEHTGGAPRKPPRTPVTMESRSACSAVLARQPSPLSPARGPPQSDLLTGLLDQTPAFDPAEPEPHPAFEFDQSLPRRLRPLSSLTVAGSPALACGAHPRIPLAQHLAELLRLLPRQPLCGCPIRASPPHFASGHGSPFEYPIGRSASEEGYSRRPPCLPPRWMRTV
jgi:hypothetical protein